MAMSESLFYNTGLLQWPSCDKCGLMDKTDSMQKPAANFSASLFNHSRRQDGTRWVIITVTVSFFRMKSSAYRWSLQCNQLIPHSGVSSSSYSVRNVCDVGVGGTEGDTEQRLMFTLQGTNKVLFCSFRDTICQISTTARPFLQLSVEYRGAQKL